jgi:hypothetical protein
MPIERLVRALLTIAMLTSARVAVCADTPYQGQLPRSQVVMSCARGGGSAASGSLILNGSWTTFQISCDGRMVATFPDSSRLASAVSADSALTLAADLVAHDFFGVQPVFGSERGELQPVADGAVEVTRSYRDFGVQDLITLQLGPNTHTVELKDPAPAAPDWLRGWLHRFYALAQVGLSAVER